MFRERFSSFSNFTSKSNAVNIVLVGNSFIWYFTVLSELDANLSKDNPASSFVWVVHFSALILSALAGAQFSKQLKRSNFLIFWIVAGVVSSLMLFALSSTSVLLVCLVSLFLGVSLGFGMPACMSYFSDSVAIESRGRVSGITMLVTGIGIVGFRLALDNPLFPLFLIGIVLGIWRFSSLFVFLWARDYRRIGQKGNGSSFKQVLSQRSFILYFMPWVMFSFVNYIASPLIPNNDPVLTAVQLTFMAGSAVLGGFFADSVGRKRVSIAGFTMLGLGAAVLGFFGKNSDLGSFVLYFNAILDGVAWGFLLVLFIPTLWGDLSHNSSSDKYYALGVMPFFISNLLEKTIAQGIDSTFDPYALFSFAAFFLFIAVLPLVYAPETLPEKAMRERELKIYVEKAQEIAQKHY
jgi:MFS family permease